MSTPNLNACDPLIQVRLSVIWYVLLLRNCGRFTAKPIAVRLFAALKPCRPIPRTSIDGIDSERGSSEAVVVANRDQAPRSSLIRFELNLVDKTRLMACVRKTFFVVRPAGVTWPLPPESPSS